jgi:predicted AlkP superfamily pyrophosphatase or phosphodiesterase
MPNGRAQAERKPRGVTIRRIGALLVLLLAPAITLRAVTPPATSPGERLAVLISVDGLMPAAYARPDELGLAVPNLRRLAANGAAARGVVGVLPSVTYPSHTTLITGVPPRLHGILYNTYFDPLAESNDAWLWYAREIRVPTLVSAARSRGRTVGAVSWPVSVGLDADYLVPEFWRSGSTHASDLELLRALSTPGLVDAIEAFRGRSLTWPATDADRADMALTILRTFRPGLLLLHLFEVDKYEHTFGPGSREARAAIERSDAEVGRLLAAIEELGIADRTLVAVVSDHGFVEVSRIVRPNALLAENGLLEVDDKGKVRSWKAYFHSHGGTASLQLADRSDESTRRKVRELFEAKLRESGSGLAGMLDGPRIAELGGDPAAAELWLEAADGFSISRTPTGGWFGDPVDRGYHGHAPDRPALHASLILAGPGVEPGRDLGVVKMTRIAPTIAAWLGLELAREADAPLALFAPRENAPPARPPLPE